MDLRRQYKIGKLRRGRKDLQEAFAAREDVLTRRYFVSQTKCSPSVLCRAFLSWN